jgi:phage terminase large subunit
MEIQIPHKFEPREYQIPIFQAIDNGFKRIIQVWHRRAGKEKTDVNIIAKKIFEKVGAYYYVFPTYNQGKKILWNGADKDGVRFLDHFPEETRLRTVGNEMFIEFKNGSTFQVIGSDNIDSIVGTNPLGVVFSEYSLQDPKAWDYIRPILAENGGWAIFNFTPRGENHAKDLLDYAKNDPKNWYVSILNVDDTGVISREVLEQERAEIIAKNGDDSIYQQEYYNSFTAAIQGSYYGKILEKMEQDGKITNVPYEPNLPVHTWWDLGINDSMTIGFFQKFGTGWRLIDGIEGSGEGLGFYVHALREKGYVYGKHYAPHDIVVKELGTGKSRLETAKGLGLDFETVTKADGTVKSAVPNLPIEDGIQAVRMKLQTLHIDAVKCERIVKALRNYHKDYDETNKVYRNNPKHDWSSHWADMVRYWAVTPDISASIESRPTYNIKIKSYS